MSDVAENDYLMREQCFAIRNAIETQQNLVANNEDPAAADDAYEFVSVEGANVEVTCSATKTIVNVVDEGMGNDEFNQLESEVRQTIGLEANFEVTGRGSGRVAFESEF